MLTLFHSDRPKLHTILVFLNAIGLRCTGTSLGDFVIFFMGRQLLVFFHG